MAALYWPATGGT